MRPLRRGCNPTARKRGDNAEWVAASLHIVTASEQIDVAAAGERRDV